jgi:hypothetical protein
MCVLHELRVGHFFDNQILFHCEPIWGPTAATDETVTDEWWQADTTKMNTSYLSAQTREAFQLARQHCPFTLEADPVHIDPGTAAKRRQAEGVNIAASKEKDISKYIVQGYHATARDRFKAVLEEGFESGPNVCEGKYGAYTEPHQSRACCREYAVYNDECSRRPGYVTVFTIIAHCNLTKSAPNRKGGHQRVYPKTAILPRSVIVHFVHSSKLMNDGRRGLYRVYRGVFDARGVDMAPWVARQQARALNLDKQEAKWQKQEEAGRKHELKFLEQERMHQRTKEAEDGYFAQLKTLSTSLEKERKRQVDLHQAAVADRVPQLLADSVDQRLPETTDDPGRDADEQFAIALIRMELDESTSILTIVDETAEVARIENMLIRGEVDSTVRARNSARFERPTAVQYQTLPEAHQAVMLPEAHHVVAKAKAAPGFLRDRMRQDQDQATRVPVRLSSIVLPPTRGAIVETSDAKHAPDTAIAALSDRAIVGIDVTGEPEDEIVEC